jgi:DNA repair protein RecN (Recombination protein N)
MLENLLIKNYVIVDELDLSFLLGFSSLTGETGAGKSILIDALSLALGSRSESGVVKKGMRRRISLQRLILKEMMKRKPGYH